MSYHNDHDKDKVDHGPRALINDMAKKVDFGEDIDFVVGVTATALTADQLLKTSACHKEHKVMHLAKAGLGAAVAATAFTMMSREHNEHRHKERIERGRALVRIPTHHPVYEISDGDSDSLSDLESGRSRRRLMIEDGRHHGQEDWAAVHRPQRSHSDEYYRPRSPVRTTRREDEHGGIRSADHFGYYPYAEGDGRRDSKQDEWVPRRARSHSEHRDHEHKRREREERSESRGPLTKFLVALKEGLEAKQHEHEHEESRP
ncbi:hypothetical protein B0H66DRAFT_97834 [Apodospora peruviana]|uniref:Uncharacterized protein n=1 Tax=Apodospora peruviana TaxID=516989 RepID=A0AAE0IUF1_9PEZI|nr:hypothetical protein B0H66DRAFT_97834 [Apodospora peruviana]